jgi:hypothetical protein
VRDVIAAELNSVTDNLTFFPRTTLSCTPATTASRSLAVDHLKSRSPRCLGAPDARLPPGDERRAAAVSHP